MYLFSFFILGAKGISGSPGAFGLIGDKGSMLKIIFFNIKCNIQFIEIRVTFTS